MAHMGIGVSAPAERAAINREEDIYNEIKERHLGLEDRLGQTWNTCYTLLSRQLLFSVVTTSIFSEP